MTNQPIPDPVELLQTLIRFDTTNPPGSEIAAITYLDDLLQSQGIATTILAKDPQRPNLIAHLPGRGDTPRRCSSTATSMSSARPIRPGPIPPSPAA